VKLLEDLKLNFPLKEVALYGFCIVVPGPEFDPDWEAELGDHGYKCFDTFLDGKPVTLVRVAKTEKGSGEKTVYSPPPSAKASAEGEKETLIPRASPSSKWRPEEDEVLIKLWNDRVLIEKMTPSFPGRTEAAIRLRIQRLEKYGKIKKRSGRGRLPKSQSDSVTKSPGEQAGLERVLKGKDTPLGPRWTEDEYKLLIKLWNERKKIREIAVKFPTRSGHAVGSALGRLKNSGAIEPRWTQKKNRFEKVDAEPEPAPMQPLVEKSVDTPVHTAVTLDKLALDVKGILDVLDVQGRVLDKLFCALLMQAVEVKQEKGDLSIPPGLWIHYANALVEDDKQFREKFRLKVEQLLEASS
jgi:hypothetical protein